MSPGATGSVPVHIGTGTLAARDEDLNRGTIPMHTFARRPSTKCSLFLVDIPQNSRLDSKDSRKRNYNSINSHTLSTLFVGRSDSKNQETICSDFPSEAMLWIKEVEMVDSLDELKSSRSIAGHSFSNFEVLDAKIASALNKIIQNSHFKTKVSLEEQKAQKEDPVSTRRTDRLHDLRLL